MIFDPDAEQFVASAQIPECGRITFVGRIFCVRFAGDDDGNDMVDPTGFNKMLDFGIELSSNIE